MHPSDARRSAFVPLTPFRCLASGPTLDPVRKGHLVGFMLWRAGLLLVASYSAIRVARLAWAHLDLPPLMDWGLGLAAAGALLVALSFVMERIQDSRLEEGLHE